MKKFCNQNGFTLVECMVSVTILTVILGAVLAYLFMTLNTYKQEAENNNVNLDGRTMLAIMTNKLREAKNISLKDSGKDTKITYTIGEQQEELSAEKFPWDKSNYEKITLFFEKKHKVNGDATSPYIIEIELTLDNSKFTTSVFPLNQ